MSATTTVTVVCDHLGCEAAVEGPDLGHARRTARRAGWLVGTKKHYLLRDFCPEHRDNRSFYA